MRIKLESFVDSPDVEICENIKISGREVSQNETYEYLQPLTISCLGCNEIHEVWILIG